MTTPLIAHGLIDTKRHKDMSWLPRSAVPLDLGGVVAILSPVAPLPDTPTEQQAADWEVTEAVRHDRILSRIAAKAAVLPIRFAAIYSSRAAAADGLAGLAANCGAELDQLHGNAQYDVVLVPRPGGDGSACDRDLPGTHSGRSYLARQRDRRGTRLGRQHAVQKLLDDLELAVRPLARRSLTLTPRKDRYGGVSLLLDPADADALIDGLRALDKAAGQHRMEFAIRGPRPAYDFAATTQDTDLNT